MCMKFGCLLSRCGCCHNCNCNKCCFECKSCEPKKYYNVRNKFVCFDCKRIWKSPISKYVAFDEKICKIYVKNYYNFSKINRKEQINNCYNNYFQKKSRCAKCGKDGNLVGRNFRHCKTKKEWINLKKNVDIGKINLITDFNDYPKNINII